MNVFSFPVLPPAVIDAFSLFILIENGRLDSKVTVDYYHYFFLLLFLVELGLHCCSLAFSSCGEWGLLLVAVSGFPIAGASLV